MSNAVFPTLPGLKLEAREAPVWATKVLATSSGKEQRAAYQGTPRYRYSLSCDFLSQTDATTLINFFNARQGRFDSFLITDPWSSVQVAVRFDTDELGLERLAVGVWKVDDIPLLSVK